MSHNMKFYQGLHSFFRQKRKKVQFYLENITYDLSMYIMDNPKFIVRTHLCIKEQMGQHMIFNS